MVIVWLLLGIALLAVEMHHFAFFALFGAVGAFAAGVTALLWPEFVVVQILVAVAVAVVGVVMVRPHVSEAVARRGEGHAGRGVHGTLVGEEVLTLDLVGDTHHPGHVQLVGERWLAVSGSDTPILEGTRVLVTGVQGTTLTVWPVDGAAIPLPDHGSSRSDRSPDHPDES